ncbi:MAG TPA: winged helix-turn-helix domain-containing protein [Armatimonadota bacterium]|nr:winged helix-turn-helix domain-containing protein [Armatimonadota bacterium]
MCLVHVCMAKLPRNPQNTAALETCRMEAGPLFEAGMSGSEVARRLGVSAHAACGGRRKWQEGGVEALRSIGPRGYRPALGAEELRILREELLRGPRAHGYSTDLWALTRIVQVIKKRFGVQRSVTQVWQIMQQMGFSCQKPSRRAKQRNEEWIAAWQAEEWPRVLGGALNAHATVVFVDESGCSQRPNVRQLRPHLRWTVVVWANLRGQNWPTTRPIVWARSPRRSPAANAARAEPTMAPT